MGWFDKKVCIELDFGFGFGFWEEMFVLVVGDIDSIVIVWDLVLLISFSLVG